LLAVVAGLALLPGSGFAFSWAPAGFGAVVLAAVLLTPRAIAFTAAVAIVALASIRDREWRVPGLIALAASGLGALVTTWGAPDPAGRTVFLIAKELTTDRILIAVAIITIITLLTGRRSRLTWLALAGLFTAGVLALTTGEGMGAFQLAAPAVLMAAAAGVIQYIRADLAAIDSAAAGKTQQPA
jgi:ABC-type proline/glycine betaine transport system permease subunit